MLLENVNGATAVIVHKLCCRDPSAHRENDARQRYWSRTNSPLRVTCSRKKSRGVHTRHMRVAHALVYVFERYYYQHRNRQQWFLTVPRLHIRPFGVTCARIMFATRTTRGRTLRSYEFDRAWNRPDNSTPPIPYLVTVYAWCRVQRAPRQFECFEQGYICGVHT